VVAPSKERQHADRVGIVNGLAQPLAVDADDRVSRKDVCPFILTFAQHVGQLHLSGGASEFLVIFDTKRSFIRRARLHRDLNPK